MLTRPEYNELYRLIERLNDAWEEYVHVVSSGDLSDRGHVAEMGIKVTDAKEALLKYLKEELQ